MAERTHGVEGMEPQQVRKCLYCEREMIVGSECTSAAQAGQCDMAPGKTFGGPAPQIPKEKP